MKGWWGLMLGALALVGGCGSDLIDVDLDRQVYRADFGSQTGTVPTVACAPDGVDACMSDLMLDVFASAASAPSQATISGGCDAAAGRCFVQANARAAMALKVLDSDDFITKVERHSVWLVRSVDLALTVPVNTLNFDVPAVDIYVGPDGSTRETDASVAPVGSIARIPAGTAVAAEQHVVITHDSPARALIEYRAKNRQPFVLIFVLSPRLAAGDPIPSGAIQVDVVPTLRLGI